MRNPRIPVPTEPALSEVEGDGMSPARKRLLRNSMSNRDAVTRPIPAAKRRHRKARHGSAGKLKAESTESASADGTRLVTARKRGEEVAGWSESRRGRHEFSRTLNRPRRCSNAFAGYSVPGTGYFENRVDHSGAGPPRLHDNSTDRRPRPPTHPYHFSRIRLSVESSQMLRR